MSYNDAENINTTGTPLSSLKFLLIDDENDFNIKFKKTINKYGHTVISTTDPKEGIRIVDKSYTEHNPYDAVFIDYLMPDLNGIETARALKKIDPDLLLIAITRDETIETKVMIIKSMAFDLFFEKGSTYQKISKILACIESTKDEQYSGRQSRLSKKLKADKHKAGKNKTDT